MRGVYIKMAEMMKNFNLLLNKFQNTVPLIFQYNHYFESTYGSGYNTVDTNKVPEALKHLEGKQNLLTLT